MQEQRKESPSNVIPKLFDLKKLLDNLEIPPKLQRRRKVMVGFEGLTKEQIRERLRKPICFQSGVFRENWWYDVYVYIGEFFLFLFNKEKECFSAFYFSVNWLEKGIV